MASVFLDFVPPDRPGFVTLEIFEAPAHDGSFTSIEVVSDIGEYPDYITRYSSNLATSVADWFAIQWTDDKGVKSQRSEAMQGNTESLVGILVSRIMLRNSSLDENVVLQEVENLIQEFFGVVDPYTIDPASVRGRIMTGLTLLGMARSQLFITASGGASASWTAGLVSMKSSTDTSFSTVEMLLKQASQMLGLNISRVAQMATPEIAGGLVTIVSADISRLQIEVE